jgi:hypothetical protein
LVRAAISQQLANVTSAAVEGALETTGNAALVQIATTSAFTPEQLEMLKTMSDSDNAEMRAAVESIKDTLSKAVAETTTAVGDTVLPPVLELSDEVVRKVIRSFLNAVSDIPGVGIALAALGLVETAVQGIGDAVNVVEKAQAAIQPVTDAFTSVQGAVSELANAASAAADAAAAEAKAVTDAAASAATEAAATEAAATEAAAAEAAKAANAAAEAVSAATDAAAATEAAKANEAKVVTDAAKANEAKVVTDANEANEAKAVSAATEAAKAVSAATEAASAATDANEANEAKAVSAATDANEANEAEAAIGPGAPGQEVEMQPMGASVNESVNESAVAKPPQFVEAKKSVPDPNQPFARKQTKEEEEQDNAGLGGGGGGGGGSRKRRRIHKLSRRIARTLRRVQKKYGLTSQDNKDKDKNSFLRRTLKHHNHKR